MPATTILALSDTHIPEQMMHLPQAVLDAAGSVDCICHMGDFTSLLVYEQIRRIGMLYAVHGNCDGGDLHRRLPEDLIFELGGRKIALTHGSGPRMGIEQRVRDRFERDKPDLILFGHSHVPYNETVKGVRIVNPGSAAQNYTREPGTYALIILDDVLQVRFCTADES